MNVRPATYAPNPWERHLMALDELAHRLDTLLSETGR